MSAAGIASYRPQATDYDLDDRATVAVFATVLTMVFAGLSYRAGLKFNLPLLGFAIPVGLSLFMSVSPFIVWRVSARGHYDEPEPWWRSQSTLTIAAVAILGLEILLENPGGLVFWFVVALLGWLSSMAAFLLWIFRGKPILNLLFLAGAGAFAVWACGIAVGVSGAGGASPLVSDTKFNSLVYSGISTPFFFTAILLLAVELKKSWSAWPGDAERPLRTDYTAWFFLIIVSIGVIPSSGLDAMAMGNRYGMISGSSPTAVSLFLLTTATTVAWWRRKTTSPSIGDFVFLLALVPLMLVSIGLVNGYLMLLLAFAGTCIVLLGRMFRDRLVGASTLVCLAITAAAWKLMSIASWGQIGATYSLRSIDQLWWPYFLLLNLFWSWLYICVRVREERLETVGAIRGAALEGRITDVVVVAIVTAAAIAGWLATELSGKGSGFAASASDLDRWLALSLLMASAWRWLVQWRKQKEDSAPVGGVLGSIRISQLWLAALAIPVGITILLNVLRTTLALRH